MRAIQRYQRFLTHPDPLRPTQTSGDRANRGASFLPYWPPFRVLDLSTTDASVRRVLPQLNECVANTGVDLDLCEFVDS